jgi:hypothetical protein
MYWKGKGAESPGADPQSCCLYSINKKAYRFIGWS